MEASPTSAALKTSTSSDSPDETSSGGTKTPAPTPGSSDAGTALYSYTLTSDDTRILYSVMKSLANGNKTKDVVIKQSNVEFTFPKGTMTDTYTKLWYDFGATINNSIAEQTAKELAGDAYVATIHYNYEGELPGTANIRIWLGAANAGKTLYYYKLEGDKSLSFMQTAVADSTGWVTVTQKSCSDYVFLSKDLLNAVTTPRAHRQRERRPYRYAYAADYGGRSAGRRAFRGGMVYRGHRAHRHYPDRRRHLALHEEPRRVLILKQSRLGRGGV